MSQKDTAERAHEQPVQCRSSDQSRRKGATRMSRISFIINLKPGADPVEYKRRHDEIWPEMVAALRGAGIRNYSIFRDGSRLFAYVEVDDAERMATILADDPVNARWQAYMRDMIDVDVDPETGFARLLPEMFHMD
jgi:L-rhamnose mutarotase